MNVDPGDAHFEIVVQDNLAFCRDHRAHFKAPRTVLDGGGYDRRQAADREPYLRPDRHARRCTRVLNISV